MSVRVTLNCELKSNAYANLLPFLEENLPNVRGFKGNRQVNVFFDNDKCEMLLEEKWQSVESHQDYLGFIEKSGVLTQLNSFLSSPPVIKYFVNADI